MNHNKSGCGLRLMSKLVHVSKTLPCARLTSELVPGMVFKAPEGYVKVSDCLLHPTLKQLGRIIHSKFKASFNSLK